jgi:hypothetical protein
LTCSTSADTKTSSVRVNVTKTTEI